MVLNDTFNNISVCFRGLGLWFLTTLSIIFQVLMRQDINRVVEPVINISTISPIQLNVIKFGTDLR